MARYTFEDPEYVKKTAQECIKRHTLLGSSEQYAFAHYLAQLAMQDFGNQSPAKAAAIIVQAGAMDAVKAAWQKELDKHAAKKEAAKLRKKKNAKLKDIAVPMIHAMVEEFLKSKGLKQDEMRDMAQLTMVKVHIGEFFKATFKIRYAKAAEHIETMKGCIDYVMEARAAK